MEQIILNPSVRNVSVWWSVLFSHDPPVPPLLLCGPDCSLGCGMNIIWINFNFIRPNTDLISPNFTFFQPFELTSHLTPWSPIFGRLTLDTSAALVGNWFESLIFMLMLMVSRQALAFWTNIFCSESGLLLPGQARLAARPVRSVPIFMFRRNTAGCLYSIVESYRRLYVEASNKKWTVTTEIQII